MLIHYSLNCMSSDLKFSFHHKITFILNTLKNISMQSYSMIILTILHLKKKAKKKKKQKKKKKAKKKKMMLHCSVGE